jgi:ketosteroid isomerase-like protein
MSITISQIREEMADREAIRDCLLRYTRGIDRGDLEMLQSAYWPDATDDHGGFFSGSAADYIAMATNPAAVRTPTAHIVTNEMIRIDGATAAVESYVYAIHIGMTAGQGAPRDIIAAARYLDKFERRGDEWRIAARVVAIDWFREYADTLDWTIGPFGFGDVDRGRAMPADKSYSWLGLT